MKRFLLSVVLATTLAFTSCETNDLGVWKELNAHSESIKDLYDRVSALEELCKQMNDNISSLQAIIQALNTGVYITNVAPVTSGGVTTGYTITFSDGKSITIYHGKDGKDGDGANDGNTPQIGVAQDADGIYYWTIDGEWMLDSNDNKVKAVGTDGKDGQDGKDGITPRLKIENDYWYVSYDEGKTWTQLGKATGEDGQNGADGSNGSNGSNGDSLFKSVTQDEDNVYFTLSDGTVITVPKFNKGDIENLLERIQSVSYVPNYSDGKATVEYNNSTSRVTLDFEVSPKDAITELAKVWYEAISVKAVYTKSRAVSFIDMPIIEFDANATNGIISVTASGENLSQEFFAGSQEASVRLAISDGNNSVTSEYISLVATEIMSYNEIWYTNGSTTTPTRPNSNTSVFGANIVSNTYDSAKECWVLKFDGDVTSIGGGAFRQNSTLVSISLPNSVTEVDRLSFEGCINLSSFYGKFASADNRCLIIDNKLVAFASAGLAEYTIPNYVTKIGSNAFALLESLTTITIPNSVIVIEFDAFYSCLALRSITIPDSVMSIESGAFRGCKYLASFYGKFASADNRCWIVDGVLNSFAPAGLTEYTIPDSVTSIGDYAFYNCKSLTSVTIPNSVTSIGSFAFYYCKSLTSVTIPDSVTSIGAWAFEMCSSLTSVTIPDSVTSIGERAFAYCDSLTSVYCKPTIPPTGGPNMFINNPSGRKIYVPRNSVEAYKSASYWSDYASYIVGMDNAEDNPCEIGVVATKFSQAYPSYSAQYPDHTALAFCVYGTVIKSAKYIVAKSSEFERFTSQGVEMSTLVVEQGDDATAEELAEINSESGWISHRINLEAATEYTIAIYATNEYGNSALATATHTTDAAPEYTGELAIGQYYMACTVETDQGARTFENVFTVSPNGDNFLVSDLGVNDDGQHKFHAVYDATASTLTIDGTYYGLEQYGSLFGSILYGEAGDYVYTIFSYNSAESAGKDPIVFGVDPTTKQISSLQTAEFEVAAYTSDGNSFSYVGSFAIFQGAGTTIVPYTATASKQSVKAENFVPYRNATAVRAPKANIKSKIKACKSVNLTSKSMVGTKSIRL